MTTPESRPPSAASNEADDDDPGKGPSTVRILIQPPAWMRHDPVNGRRYADQVEVAFADRAFELGRKPSPDAAPRGGETGFAGPTG